MIFEGAGKADNGHLMLWILFPPTYFTVIVDIKRKLLSQGYEKVIPKWKKNILLLEDLVLELGKLDGLNEVT